MRTCPEYALAIDRYAIVGEAGPEDWLYVQEYEGALEHRSGGRPAPPQ